MLPSPAGREASPGTGAPPYVRHRPERTLLYQLVEEHYPAFKAHLGAQDMALPAHVEQEFDMLFLDGIYVERPDGSLRFHWVKAPSGTELPRLTQMLARRIGRHLERQGLLERDAENSYLAGDGLETGPMEQLLGSSITYRIAGGPQQGCKVFTLQTLPGCGEPFNAGRQSKSSISPVLGFNALPW